jgi:transcriptional regulator with XRE-family HTH domain
MARRKTPAFGRWLVASRKTRGWTQDAAIGELKALTGVGVTRNWLSQLEGGEAPSPELRQAWERLYGSAPSENGPEEGGDLSALVAELREANRLNRELIGWLVPLATRALQQGVAEAEEQLRSAGDTPDEPPQRH